MSPPKPIAQCFTDTAIQEFQQYLREESNNKSLFSLTKRLRYRAIIEEPDFLPPFWNDCTKQEKQAFHNDKRLTSHYHLIDRQLYRNAERPGEQPRVVACNYDAHLHVERIHKELGHAGSEKTYIEVKRQVYGITKADVRWLKKRCLICNLNQPNNTRAPLEPIVTTRILERIQVDLIDMRHEPSGTYKWILHVKDHFSKFSALYALRSKRASDVAQALELYINHYGPPEICQCDNGREFKGALLILFARMGVRVINGRPRTPRTQGLVEQGNSVVKDKLRKWKLQAGSPLWHFGLFSIARAINSQSHRGLPKNWTPHYAFYSRNVRILSAKKGAGIDLPKALAITTDSAEVASGLEAYSKHIDMLAEDESGEAELDDLAQGVILGESIPTSEDELQDEDNSSVYEQEAPIPSGNEAIPIDPSLLNTTAAGTAAMEESNVEIPIRQHQEKVREQMQASYNGRFYVKVYQAGDFVTAKVPREDRTASDNLRLLGKVIEVPHTNRYLVLCRHGIIDRHFPAGELNPLPNEDKVLYEKMLEGAPRTRLTLHEAAAKESTSTRVPTSCNCKKECKTKRCLCIKRDVKCTQYCHDGGRNCGNQGTIREGTEEAIVVRDRGSGGSKGGKQPQGSGATKRARSTSTIIMTTKRVKQTVQEPARTGQMTLSQYVPQAPITRRLRALQVQREAQEEGGEQGKIQELSE